MARGSRGDAAMPAQPDARIDKFCLNFNLRLKIYGQALASEQNTQFEQTAGLRCICAVRAERQPRGGAVCSDVRNLRPGKEDLVLISRCKGYRPCLAAGTIQKIGRSISKTAGRADILEANRQANARQEGLIAEAVICQDRPANRRS